MIPALMFYATKLRNIIRINKFYFHTKFAAFYAAIGCHYYVFPTGMHYHWMIPYFLKLGTYTQR